MKKDSQVIKVPHQPTKATGMTITLIVVKVCLVQSWGKSQIYLSTIAAALTEII